MSKNSKSSIGDSTLDETTSLLNKPDSTDAAEASSASDTVTPFSREQKLLLACLGSGSLMAGCLVAVMIPFFPLEAARRGISQTMIGSVFSCFAATQIVVYPITGRLVPRVGVTRAYCAGLAAAGISTAAFGALPHIAHTDTFLAACFVTRMVEALAISWMNTAALTMVANKFPDRTNTAVAITETMTGVGISLGPAVGGALYFAGGYGLPFYVLAGLMLVVGGITYPFMPRIGRYSRHTESYWPLLKIFAGNAESWLCCLILFTVSMNWTAIDPGIEPYVFAELGITPSQLGLYFLVATGSFTVCSYFWGRLHDRIANNYALITLCLAGATIGLLLLSPSPLLPLQPSWWLLGVGMVIKELSQGGIFIPLFPKMLQACLARGMDNTILTQSFISSVFWTVFSLGNVIGPTVGGVIIDVTNFPTMTTVLAGWCLMTACFAAAKAVNVWRASKPRAQSSEYTSV